MLYLKTLWVKVFNRLKSFKYIMNSKRNQCINKNYNYIISSSKNTIYGKTYFVNKP